MLAAGARVRRERMQTSIIHSPRARSLQASDDVLAAILMLSDDDMHVVGHDSAGVNSKIDFAANNGETLHDGLGVHSGQLYRRKFERASDRLADSQIVRLCSQRMSRMDFGGFAARFVDVLCLHARRAAAARIVRGPESVGGENEVLPYHGE